MNKHIRLFNRIANVYGWFYKAQRKQYKKRVIPKLPIDFKEKRVIDIGAGTGALSSVLDELGAEVLMLDGSEKMLETARKKQAPNALQFTIRDILKEPIEDLGQFDVVISAYVAHGLNSDQRQTLYRKMQQLSKQYIVFYEHRKSKNVIVKFVEYLEDGDYFNYVRVAEKELKTYYNNLTVIPVSKRSVLYLVEVK